MTSLNLEKAQGAKMPSLLYLFGERLPVHLAPSASRFSCVHATRSIVGHISRFVSDATYPAIDGVICDS